jgi:hypothetical protein
LDANARDRENVKVNLVTTDRLHLILTCIVCEAYVKFVSSDLVVRALTPGMAVGPFR